MMALIRGTGIDKYTKLLCHCDAAGALFFDNSSSRRTITRVDANTSTSNVQMRFSKSMYSTSGSGDATYTGPATTAGVDSPMTVDLWFYGFAQSGGTHAFMSHVSSATAPTAGDWGFGWYGGSYLQLYTFRYTGSGTTKISYGHTFTFSASVWHHIVMSWIDSTHCYVGMDGVAYLNPTINFTPGNSAGYGIGMCQGNSCSGAYLDEIRITDGIARVQSTTYIVPLRAVG